MAVSAYSSALVPSISKIFENSNGKDYIGVWVQEAYREPRIFKLFYGKYGRDAVQENQVSPEETLEIQREFWKHCVEKRFNVGACPESAGKLGILLHNEESEVELLDCHGLAHHARWIPNDPALQTE